jgi:hypothetical protein
MPGLTVALALVASPFLHALQTGSLSNSSQDQANASAISTQTLEKPAPVAPLGRDMTLKWKTSWEGDSAVNELNSHRTEFLMTFRFIFDVKVNSYLAMNLTPELVGQSGFIQAPDVENPQASRMDIINASVDLTPSPYIKISAGSLSERNAELHSGLLFRDLSFPAARLVVQTNPDRKSRAFIYGESAVPTSSSLNNNSNDYNTVPSLTTAGIGFDYDGSKSRSDGFISKTRLSYYEFKNLPLSVSTASVLLGNTGVSTSGADYGLASEFQGFEGLSINEVKWGHWLAELKLAGLQNEKADNGKNTGSLATIGIGRYFSKNLSIVPYYTFFRIESDATVAAYNNSYYNTNTNGTNTGLVLGFSDQYFIQFSYENRLPLVQNPTQPAEQISYIQFRTEALSF